jgi:hypothetical protein
MYKMNYVQLKHLYDLLEYMYNEEERNYNESDEYHKERHVFKHVKELSKIFDVVNLDITQKRKKTINDFF